MERSRHRFAASRYSGDWPVVLGDIRSVRVSAQEINEKREPAAKAGANLLLHKKGGTPLQAGVPPQIGPHCLASARS
jgi:hypothetical protein